MKQNRDKRLASEENERTNEKEEENEEERRETKGVRMEQGTLATPPARVSLSAAISSLHPRSCIRLLITLTEKESLYRERGKEERKFPFSHLINIVCITSCS